MTTETPGGLGRRVRAMQLHLPCAVSTALETLSSLNLDLVNFLFSEILHKAVMYGYFPPVAIADALSPR